MTAAEARALTDKSKADSWVDHTLRTEVYPRIEHAARHGQSTVTVCVQRWSYQICKDDAWKQRMERLTSVLRVLGYKAARRYPLAGLDVPCEEVEVSW